MSNNCNNLLLSLFTHHPSQIFTLPQHLHSPSLHSHHSQTLPTLSSLTQPYHSHKLSTHKPSPLLLTTYPPSLLSNPSYTLSLPPHSLLTHTHTYTHSPHTYNSQTLLSLSLTLPTLSTLQHPFLPLTHFPTHTHSKLCHHSHSPLPQHSP